MKDFAAISTVLLAGALLASASVKAATLELADTIELANVKGRIDHLSHDLKERRLFVAALGNDTVEVVGIRRDLYRSITGFGEPQGVLYMPESKRLFIANGQADRVDIVDAGSFSVVKRLGDMPDSDNVRYDAAARQVVVGYGRGALRFLDPDTGSPVGEIALPGHPESFQLEREGSRAFVNVPSSHAVVVVDRRTRAIVATWTLPLTAWANYPMALDEAGHRLFVVTRKPARLLVYDTGSGNVVANLPIGGDTDDLFYDGERKRVYAVCGEGRVDVIREDGRDRYVLESSTRTAPRARTGLFVPEESTLYVAAPVDGSTPARILVYRLR